MAAILNSTMLDLDTAILDSDTFLSSLRFTQKHSHSTLTLDSNKFNLTQTYSFSLNLMMAATLNSAILDSAILHKSLTQTNSFWLKLIHSDSTWWWQPSWNSAILNLAILDSAILVFPIKLTHTCQDWFPPFAQKKPFTHSFWLNLMMTAI